MALPNGYVRLEYIEGTGTQYIDTGLSMPYGFRAELEIEFTQSRNTVQYIIGSHELQEPYGRNYLGANENLNSWNFGFDGYSHFGTLSPNTTYRINVSTVHQKVSCTINDQVYTFDQSLSTIPTRSPNSVYLFNVNSFNTAPSMLRLYECKIYDENDTLVRDYVPCQSISGVSGLFDLVNSTFYSNDGSGSFVSGKKLYDIDDCDRLEYIESTGTQWIDTLVYPETETRIQTKISMKSVTGDAVIGHMGSHDVQLDNADYRIFNYDNQFYLDIMSARIFGGSWLNNVVYEIEFGNHYVKFLSNGSIIVTGSTVSYVNTSTTIKIFKGLSNNAQAYLYYLKIYSGDTLIRHYVPVRTFDGLVGLYDLKESEFYENDGTESFIAGPLAFPDSPTNLKASVLNGTVYLIWNASPSDDVSGYKVYIDNTLVGTTTSLGYHYALAPSQNHTISVTAYSDNGESDPITVTVSYELPNPPTNLDAEFDEGTIHLLWTDSTTEDVQGYRVYQNGELIGTTPSIFALFEFPFSNESLTEKLLEISSQERVEFYQAIEPRTQYTFSVTAFDKYGESDPVSISIYYDTYLDIESIALIPNPVYTGESLTISASIDELYDVTIT